MGSTFTKIRAWLSGRTPDHGATGEQVRGTERDRRVVLSGVASMATKVVTIAVMLVTVPMSVRYLGGERYGLWMTVTSVVAVLGFADLGIGNGLVTALAAAHGRDDQLAAARLVTSAFFLSLGLALVVVVIFAIALPVLDWNALLNVSSSQARKETRAALGVLVACFAAGLPLGVVQRVQAGYQEAFLTNLWLAGGSLVGLAGVLLSIKLGATLPAFVAASAGGPVLALGGATLIEFSVRRPQLRPRLACVDWTAARELLGTGALFITMQVAVTVLSAADNLVAARVLGPASVAELSLAARLFSVSPMILGMFLGPLWPAYGEAQARGDGAWIRRTLGRSLLAAALVGIPIGATGLLFGQRIILAWVGPQVMPDVLVLAGLASWSVVASLGGAVAMFLNGLQVVRFQAGSAAVMAMAALAGKVWLAREVGLAGIPWASVGANIVFVAIPSVFVVRKQLAGLATLAAPASKAAAVER